MQAWLKSLGALGGLFGAAGVGLAAIGAHRSGNPNVTTAATFLLIHAGGIMALCTVAVQRPTRGVLVATSLIALGTILFSGELAIHALADLAPLPLAAPTGGMLMIIGWLVAAVTVPASIGHPSMPR